MHDWCLIVDWTGGGQSTRYDIWWRTRILQESSLIYFLSTMPPIAVVALVVVLYLLWCYRAAIFSAHCTECQEKGHGCRGHHLKCSQLSLTSEQERTWQELCDVPGVRPRATPQHATSSPDQDYTMCLILTAFLIAIVGIIFYPFIL